MAAHVFMHFCLPESLFHVFKIIMQIVQLHAESLYEPLYSNMLNVKRIIWRDSCSTTKADDTVAVAVARMNTAVLAGEDKGSTTNALSASGTIRKAMPRTWDGAVGSEIPKAIPKPRVAVGIIRNTAKAGGSAIRKAIRARLAKDGGKIQTTMNTSAAVQAEAGAVPSAVAPVTKKTAVIAREAEAAAAMKKMMMTLRRVPAVIAADRGKATNMAVLAKGASVMKAGNRNMKTAAAARAEAGAKKTKIRD